MFEGTRAIDWVMLVIEALVLFLIAYEVLEKCKADRKIKERTSQTFAFLSKGQKLQKSAPQAGAGVEATVPWVKSVHAWSQDTDAFLNTCSAHASAKFLDETNMKSVTYPGLAQEVWTFYSLLNRKLSNLQTIIQNATVYLLS